MGFATILSTIDLYALMDKLLFIFEDFAALLVWAGKAALLCAIIALPYILDAVAEKYLGLPQDYKLKL